MTPGKPDLMALWAKLHKWQGYEAGYHPLLCHMVDVAMVAQAMWVQVLPPAAKERIAKSLGCTPDEAGRHISFWAGLHDIGKASPAFQGLAPTAKLPLDKAGFAIGPEKLLDHHGNISASVFLEEAGPALGYDRELSVSLAAITGGHHGVIPDGERITGVRSQSIGKGDWTATRLGLVDHLRQIASPPDGPPLTPNHAVSMYIAGLISVSDWIGSNEKYFKLESSQVANVTDFYRLPYRSLSEDRAQDALNQLGWLGWIRRNQGSTFEQMFGGKSPRLFQQQVMDIAKNMTGPSIAIIEAPTGCGKTEAAMYLADRLISAGLAGNYFALPTMATSDQMFGRVRNYLKSRYHEDVVNLQLLHGHAALSAQFEEMKEKHNKPFAPEALHSGGESGSIEGDVVAAEWFTYRKRGLLAPFGVGTVDQCLLAALQTHHVFVRLFGLGSKVLIVDEVHAYDTYMTSLLERLLNWLAALGSPVILLSATLPRAKKDALVSAYVKGLDPKREDAIPNKLYPRITWATLDGSYCSQLDTSDDLRRALSLTWLDGTVPHEQEIFPIAELLKERLSDGGCAAVICNTVDRVQEIYLALKSYFPDLANDGNPQLDLLHARYLFEDRQDREARCLRRFGPPEDKSVQRPNKAILVATQIVEQSLDFDFDIMISDLAPIDLLLQRSGRMHRHARDYRPSPVSSPVLYVCRPEVREDGTPQFARYDDIIYEPHILLRTWLQLIDRDAIRLPDDVEDLIESVYDDEFSQIHLNEALQALWNKTKEEMLKAVERDRYEAENRWLKSPYYKGMLGRITPNVLEEDAPNFHREHQALTRLTGTTIQVVLVQGTNEDLSFDGQGTCTFDISKAPDQSLIKKLLKKSVPISKRCVIPELISREPPGSWRESALLHNHRLVIEGQPIGNFILRNHCELGVLIEKYDEGGCQADAHL